MAHKSKRADIWYQVLLLGDLSVGKTCILHRHCNSRFHKSAQPTVGVDCLETVIMKDGRRIGIMFADTGGSERFKAIMPMFYRKSDAFVLVYDITQRSSFEHVTQWMHEIDKHTNPDARGMKVMLIGNKTDLESQRVVSYKEARAFANGEHLGFFETSAKEDTNVEDAIEYLASELGKHVKSSNHNQQNIHIGEESKEPRGGCICWSSSPSKKQKENGKSAAVALADAKSPVKNQDYKGKPGLKFFQYPPDNIGELQDVAQEVSSSWKLIAHHLSVPENTIHSIEKQYKRDGADEWLMKIFDWWQKHQAKPYTWATLIDILEKPGVGQSDVAKRLRRKIEQRQPDTSV